VHSAIEFSLQHPTTTKEWHDSSNYVACLQVPNEMELMKLVDKLVKHSVKHSLFREPDYNNEATSVCIEPGELTRKFTSSYKLAFKDVPLMLSGRATVSNTVDVGSNPTGNTL
jgi:hypothetical protein